VRIRTTARPGDENLAVADLARARRLDDGLDRPLDERVAGR